MGMNLVSVSSHCVVFGKSLNLKGDNGNICYIVSQELTVMLHVKHLVGYLAYCQCSINTCYFYLSSCIYVCYKI